MLEFLGKPFQEELFRALHHQDERMELQGLRSQGLLGKEDALERQHLLDNPSLEGKEQLEARSLELRAVLGKAHQGVEDILT